MLVHPRRVFLYWVLDEGIERRLTQARGPAEILLESRTGTVLRVPFDFRSGAWYLEHDGSAAALTARLGLFEDGRFVELLRSAELPMPRIAPGHDPEVWMDWRALRAGRFEPLPPPEPGRSVSVPGRAGFARLGVSGGGLASASSPGAGVAWKGPGRLVAGSDPGSLTFLEGEPAPRRPGRPAPGSIPPLGVAEPAGYLCFVLHAHLPFVRHPEHDYFLEEQWLFEGITETYLPILDMLGRIADEEVPVRLTVSLSPTLLAMLRDPVLVAKYERHLGRLCHLASREVERTRKDPAFSPVAGFYFDRLHRYQHLFVEEYDRDLASAFARLEDRGVVELMSCAATHPFLPHHRLDPATIRAQIGTATGEHRRILGRSPRGLWLPECAYFEGLDAFLADEDLEYFFLDTHGVRNATSPPRFDVHAPLLCPSGVAAFGRDTESSVQVWSAQEGYPGDPEYRDFYRDIGYDLEHEYVAPYLDPAGTRGTTGFKYHRITGRTDWKEPYRRHQALRTAARHAADFVRNRKSQFDWLAEEMDRPPLIASMYDAELFGHWWFEGPDWLDLVLRALPGARIAAASPAQVMRAHPVMQVASPSASSWGENGYYEVWLTGENDWILPPLHDAARRMAGIARIAVSRSPGRRFETGLARRIAAQAGRELMLAQSSDWPFILRNRTTSEYARRRVHDHLDRFDRLARLLEGGGPTGTAAADAAALLRSIEERDNLFPGLDPSSWNAS
jgi:1,4-alpha-glucan branching enzyme